MVDKLDIDDYDNDTVDNILDEMDKRCILLWMGSNGIDETIDSLLFTSDISFLSFIEKDERFNELLDEKQMQKVIDALITYNMLGIEEFRKRYCKVKKPGRVNK